MKEQIDMKEVLKYTGAFIAWVIGSGFATGQEIFRFFSSFGYASYGVLFINLIGFLILGQTLILTGYRHRYQPEFQQFSYYCGNKIGKIYTLATPIVLFCLMSVLFSAAGATCSEYFGINRYIGSFGMAVVVLGTYFIGFEKFIQIASKIGPLVVIFCLLVGILSVIRDFPAMAEVPLYQETLSASQSSPHWLLSAILYLSLDFLTGSAYYTNLGALTKNGRSAKWGAILGSVLLILAITIMNTAILCNGKDAGALAIPTLYLAKKISYTLAGVFSVILLLGMFSSCAATMWSICSNVFTKDKKKNKMAAAVIALCALVLGLLPFGSLVSVLFPLIGYYGFVYIVCVVYKGIKEKVWFGALQEEKANLDA